MNNQNDNSFFYLLNIIANVLQIESYELLLKDADNNTILHELGRQNTNYLEKIVRQNSAILDRLERILERK